MRIITNFDNQTVNELFVEVIHRVVYRSYMEDDLTILDLSRLALEDVIDRICESVDVTIVSLGEMEHDGEQVMGGCWFTDDPDSSQAYEWTIGLKAASEAEIIMALVHEAMHLGQYLTGRLQTIKAHEGYEECENVWLGQTVSGLNYDEHPWELEVYGNQEEWLLDMMKDPEFVALLVRCAAG